MSAPPAGWIRSTFSCWPRETEHPCLVLVPGLRSLMFVPIPHNYSQSQYLISAINHCSHCPFFCPIRSCFSCCFCPIRSHVNHNQRPLVQKTLFRRCVYKIYNCSYFISVCHSGFTRQSSVGSTRLPSSGSFLLRPYITVLILVTWADNTLAYLWPGLSCCVLVGK